MSGETDRGRGHGEAAFTSALLLLAGGLFVVLMMATDWLKDSKFEFGPVQAAGLALGLGTIVAGIMLRRFRRVRRIVVRLWPFGAASPERPLKVLGLALWLAALAALLEVGLRFMQFELGHRWGTLNPHAMWMTLFSYIVLMLMIAGVLAFFSARGLRYLGSPRFVLFILLLVAIALPASVYSTELRWTSVGLLSLGIAFQGSRLMAALRVMVPRSAVPLAVAIVLVTACPFALQMWNERNALAALPPPPPQAPNVVLIIWDTVRAQNTSLYGYVRPTTPNLERFARRATTYDRAVAPSSWTLPSHQSMFTGRPPHQQSGILERWEAAAETFELPTLAEAMRDHGYYTLGVVANYIHTYPHTGLDRGFVRYDAGIATEWELFQVSSAGSLLKWSLNKLGVYSDLPTRKDANVITERFFNLVERREQRPFFAFMNYFDAHYDFDSPAPCEAIHPEWGLAETPVPPNVDDNKLHAPHDDVAQQPFDQERKQVLTDYDCMIAYLDDRLGALVEGLEQRGLLDQTIVIVTSDHGEEFWEHGRFGHGWNLYNTTLFVPLVIYVPKGTRAGARVPHPVDLQDLPRTVVELAGIGESTHFDGRNLLAIAEDGSATTGPILSEVALPDEPERWGRRSLVWANLHYIQNPDGSEEIYDIDEDSWEVRNLLGTPGGNAALARFRPALSSLIKDDELLSTAVEAGTSEDRAVKPRRIEARR